MWVFAALNTIEPPIIEREAFVIEEKGKPWFCERLPMVEEEIRKKLADLSRRLGADNWLEGDFTVGDLMMVMVLRRLEDGAQNLVDEYPSLSQHVAPRRSSGSVQTSVQSAVRSMKRLPAVPQRRHKLNNRFGAKQTFGVGDD